MTYETVSIYRERKKNGDYLIQPMCRHPTGASAEIGDPIELSAQDYGEQIESLVLKMLDRYRMTTFDPAMSSPQSAKEYAAFRRRYDSVSVTRLDSGVVEVVPMEHVRGGYRGMNADKVVVNGLGGADQLRDAITVALERVQ